MLCLPVCRSIARDCMNYKVRHDFPTVRRISTAQLATWLKDKTRIHPVLLDVRTDAEYQVSHLQSSVRAEPGSNPHEVNIARDTPIVTYCSVGYRSAAFAKTLNDAGYKNVVNLEGSIFQWAEEGRPLESAGRVAHEVHPYNSTWALLLDKPLRAKLP